MKKHISRIVLAAVVAVGAVAMLTGARNSDFQLSKNMEILLNMYRDVSIFYVDTVDVDKMLHDAADGMTKNLDPYTDFMSAEEVKNFEIMTTGKYGGIGAIVRKKGDYVVIAQPYKGFPADKAGLKIGDRIMEINGANVKGMDVGKVSSMLKGDPGTTLKVKVHRFYTDKEETVTIKRQRISIPGVPYFGFVAPGIGYIQHTDFSEGCSDEMRNALMQMKKSGELKGLVIDLRDNGGGILQEAVKIVSLFTAKGTEVVSTRGRQVHSNERYATASEPLDLSLPIAVLVNNSSASAAEIVSGALQDLDRAVVMGRRTFGKGLVQTTRPIGYGSLLKVTTAKYYIPSGRCIQAIDYAHRNGNGSVAAVPDSLIGEFHTRAGRKVYDGGGIMPDVTLPSEYVSRFAMVIYGKGYIEDFVDIYVKTDPRTVDADDFHLSEKAYREFVDFMKDKDVEYRSETGRLIDELRKKAEAERYIDRVRDDLDRMEQHIRDDRDNNLNIYRKEITEMIEDDIILRSSYSQGVTRHKLKSDPDVAAAIRLLGDRDEYRKIVTTQDTARK
ncbi:peptidase S41 [Bacteroidia bacterium]|nr:peptidase S41 [Bacteroidia bacterium]